MNSTRFVYRSLFVILICAVAVGGFFLFNSSHAPVRQSMAGMNMASTTTSSSQKTADNVYLSILTGQMTGSANGPAYVPSAITVPADSTVTFHITDFDNATALPPPFAKVRGVVGNTITVTPINPGNPNVAAGPSSTVSSLNANTGVGHTFTIATLGINVPVAPSSIVTFTIHTGKAGTYTWRCNDPCGLGASGWSGAMVMEGYMEGTLTVA